MRELVKLVCTECGSENYHTTKNKKEHPERMEVKKYCPKLRKYTIHKEKNKYTEKYIFFYNSK